MNENETTENTTVVATAKETMFSVLPASFPQEVVPYVTAVRDALTERDHLIREAIISEADELGYGHQAARILDVVGVEARPEPESEPEPEVELTDSQKLDAIVAGLSGLGERISKIEDAARRNGITL